MSHCSLSFLDSLTIVYCRIKKHGINSANLLPFNQAEPGFTDSRKDMVMIWMGNELSEAVRNYYGVRVLPHP